ncbi:UNVERIFIED_CONTAM: hypothetical protein GTU68_014485 [Idotea baltica]|nr:hypothetical protein [Idotea baltica]
MIDRTEILDLTSQIVAAHVSNNPVPTADLPSVIQSVFETMEELANGPIEDPVEELIPAVSVKKSITPDYLICLEDGKKLKMLKRHLKTSYDLSPEEYRTRWGLPSDYPMVAPNYAAKRQELAKKIGLGRNRKKS